MTGSHRVLFSRLLIVVGTVALTIGAMVGGLSAAGYGPEIWPWSRSAEADRSSGRDARVFVRGEGGDDSVSFPEALSGFTNPPGPMTVDHDGHLWFAIFTYEGPNELYEYDPAAGATKSVLVPASNGSEFFSAMATDSRGHIIFAEGTHVLDIDPGSGDVSELRVPSLSERYGTGGGGEGTYLTDMALDGTTAYLITKGFPIVLSLDLITGESATFSIPDEFSQPHIVAVSAGMIYVGTWLERDGVPILTGRLNPRTKEFQPLDIPAAAIESGADGSVFVAEAGTGRLLSVNGTGELQSTTQVSPSDLPLSGLRDFIAHDSERRRVWIAGIGEGSIAAVDLPSGDVVSYALPQQPASGPFFIPAGCSEEPEVCPDVANGGPRVSDVRGIAVSPDGEVYFADGNFNQIGVLHPD